MNALKTTKLTAILFSLFIVMFSSPNNMGQTVKYEKNRLSKNAIENLLMGIKSNNEGVRKSCIYFAGSYEIDEVTNGLVEALYQEKNPSIKILIALSIYKIGNPIGMEAVYSISRKDKNEKVKRILTSIYNEFAAGQKELAAVE